MGNEHKFIEVVRQRLCPGTGKSRVHLGGARLNGRRLP